MIHRVFRFNRNVIGLRPEIHLGKPLDSDSQDWLHTVLLEEAQEFADADNLVDQVDALIDSIIFAIGGLCRAGLTEQEAQACFDAVMEANEQKKAGQKAGRVVGNVQDAIKPDGWVSPEVRISKILNGDF